MTPITNKALNCYKLEWTRWIRQKSEFFVDFNWGGVFSYCCNSKKRTASAG